MSVEYFFFLLKICISVRGLRLIQGRYTQTIGKRKKKKWTIATSRDFPTSGKKLCRKSTRSCVCKLDS